MTHLGRNGLILLRDWLTRYPFVLPLAILAAGGAFRFFNLNWDDNLQLHPDERWIYMVVSGANNNPPLSWPTSISQFLEVRTQGGSPLNPHFFAYGSLPFYLLAFTAGTISATAHLFPFLSQWTTVDTYGGLPMLGRGLSASLDLVSLLVLFAIGRRVYGYWTGVLAMALGAFTVLDIQLSHFYAVDTVLLPLVLLTLLAAVDIAQRNRRAAYLWGGAALGAALATKTTALLLVIPLGGAAVLSAWYSYPYPEHGPTTSRIWQHYSAVAARLNQNLQLVLGTFIIAAVTFGIFEPYAILDRSQLLKDLGEQTTFLVTNNPPFSVPFTIQYAHTIPYVYQFGNLLFWCFGIPLGLAAFAGVVFALVRNAGARLHPDQTVLLLWVIPYFLFVGSFFAKFNRYMLPITPVMTLLGAALLVWLVKRAHGSARVLAWGALAAVTVVSFLYSLAYMNIYAHPNTRVAASQWIYTHIPAGTAIATEGAWDDPLPMPIDGRSPAIYRQAGLDPNNPGLNLYDPDDQHKIANITYILTHAQYIIMSSERMVGSIPKLPDRYPITTRYYDLLFSNRLNFRLVHQFQRHPRLGPIVVHDYSADESFHVYDHPDVRIFKRVSPISPGEVAALLARPAPAAGTPAVAQPGGGAESRLTLTASQWRADQDGQTLNQMFPPAGFAMQHPILTWLLALEILGLLAFPFVFVFLGNLSDRGFVIAKTLGLVVVGYAVWIAVSLGLATYERGLIFSVIALVALLALVLAYRLRQEMTSFIRTNWRQIVTGEAVFLAGFALFILLRMWYPDLGHQFSPVAPGNDGAGRMGEKQMELAFLNAIVRSRVFPPYDPFFAHGYINYYYYGFFLVGTLCKLTQIVPATGFNLAIATFFAMLVGNVYSAVSTLTRRLTPGVLAAIFVGLFGNLNGAWQLIRGLMSVSLVHSSIPVIGGIMDIASGAQQAIIARQPLPPFDFWEPTRILPPVGRPISEFPYFTYLFADLHPHLIAYPMTVAALALAVNLLQGSYAERWRLGLSLVMGGMLVGAIAVTNPWDFPTYLLIIVLGAFLGAFAVRRRLGAIECAWPLLWLAALGVLSFLFYLPFERSYHTVFATGIGLVRDITPRMLEGDGVAPADVRDALMTPLHIYLEHFGFFLYPLASYLLFLLLRQAGAGERMRRSADFIRFTIYYRDRIPRLRRAMQVARRIRRPQAPVADPSALLGITILLVGLLILQDFLLAFLVAMLGLVIVLVLRLGRRLPAVQLFVIVLLAVPLLLSIGTQIFFVKDWLAGGAAFRMNTIFKFYNQAWVLYAVTAASALYFFMADQIPAMMPSERLVSVTESEATPAQPATPQVIADPNGLTAHLDAQSYGMAQTAEHALVPVSVPFAASSTESQAVGLLPKEGNNGGEHAEAGAPPLIRLDEGARTVSEQRQKDWRLPSALHRPLALLDRRPLWCLCLAVLVAASLVYTYAGTVSRESYRTTWLQENSVPLTLDGMAFMKVAYPGDYAGISWLNAHVHGAQVVAEASGDAYYTWESRVSMFTGLPDILNGIHEGEQRYSDQLGTRGQDVDTLYSSPSVQDAWRIIHAYDVRYVYVGFSEHLCNKYQCYSKAGLAKFGQMVGHGLSVAYRHPGVTIYQVTGT